MQFTVRFPRPATLPDAPRAPSTISLCMGAILDVYRATRKTPDLFWNSYVCRPPAAALVHLLRSSSVTPNQITLAALGVASLAAALIVGLPGHWGILVGAVVFEFSYVLDCADGMLARLRGIQSTQGHLLDFLMDEIKAFIILGAVAVRLYLDHDRIHFLVLGIVGLVCLASGIALTTFLRRPEIAPPPAEPPAPGAPSPAPSLMSHAIRVAERVGKFFVHYPSYILYAAALGRLELYLYPYVAANALYAAKALLSVAMRFGGRQASQS